MSYSSGRVTSEESSVPSPNSFMQKSYQRKRFQECHYQDGKFCGSKICIVVGLIMFTTVVALVFTVTAFLLDNWVGMSFDPYATLNLNYPRLGAKHLDIIVFNKSLPNDAQPMFAYIDESEKPESLLTTRYGLLSNCKSPITGPRVTLFRSPWTSPMCQASFDEYQCPIVAVRTKAGQSPVATSFLGEFHGCIKKSKRCDGNMDCPSGHDEMNCNKPFFSCGEGMVQCPNKDICIPRAQVCNGVNECGMFEDERNCCGRNGFLRCADGTCVQGMMCDGHPDCSNGSDEYDCPSPSSTFMSTCYDGQLIEASSRCQKTEPLTFECNDRSDETECDFDPQPLEANPGLKSLEFDKGSQCFKQTFTFQEVNDEILEMNYPDAKQRQIAKTYDFSRTKLAILGCIGTSIFLCCLGIFLLALSGFYIKKCRSMYFMFIVLALIFFACLIEPIIVAAYWMKYRNVLNDLLTNPSGSDPYERVFIETLRVTAGLTSIQISTNLTLYSGGLFFIAFIFSIAGSCIAKKSSCHHEKAQEYTGEYKSYFGHLGSSSLDCRTKMLPQNSINGNDGIATPDQTVTPQRSFRSLNPSEASMGDNRFHSTYVSYNKDTIDSLDRVAEYHVTTLDRASQHTVGSCRNTPV